MTLRRGLLTCFLYLFAACATARGETVALTTGQDDPPFTDRTRSDGGIATRLVLEVFRVMGAPSRLDWLPWRRGYNLTKSGVYQASFPYLWTAERERDFLYSDVIFTDASYLWTRSDDVLAAGDPSRFEGRTVCVPRGFYSPLLDMLAGMIARREVTVESPDTPERCIQMLAAGRVDALSGQEAEIALPIQALGLAGRIVHDPTPLARLDFHVIFSKEGAGAADLLGRFNATLRHMKDDGRYAALMAR